ncbi:nuclear factor 7, brain-like [Genypterus blacodes]|uniref:nuclear factor 7, brain-like n=1 Tax=Genypterus blacodes TaxID=154954 RepID=UPI003F777488
MASQEKNSLEDMLTCPVCQDIFRDPRQLPCGHSMCMLCMEGVMDHSSDIPFRCPDCRAQFGPVVGVFKTFSLTSIAEDYKTEKTMKAKQTRSVHCDWCPERTALAVKTCLKCEVSMCEDHMKDHQELPVFSGHPLVKPLGDLQERKCPEHEDAVLKYYCNTSRRYICNICALESKNLNKATEACSVLRRQLTEDMEQHFNLIQEKIKKCRSSVEKLQEEIQHDRQNPADTWLNSVTVVLISLWIIVLYYAFTYSVENQTLNDVLNKQSILMKGIYFKVAGPLTLDRDSASPFLSVSSDLVSVERLKSKLHVPDQFSRFDVAPQILSTQCFTAGTHYWEVDAEGYWEIAVTYQSIKRKGKEGSTFGNNPESWSLMHNDKGQLFAYHNKMKTVISETLQSHRIAVAVDIEEGKIIFSSVGPTVIQLHEFQAKLTQPVCLGLGLYRVNPLSRASIVKAP